MKKLLALFLAFTLIAPSLAFAAFPTKSLLLASASSQYASIAYLNQTGLELNGTNFTIELWYKPTSSTGNHAFFSRGFDVAQSGVRFWRDTTNGLSLQLANLSTYYLFNNWTETLNNGTWYHIAVTFDNTSKTAELFVNGTSQGTQTVASAVTGIVASVAYVGSTIGAAWFVDGNVGLLRVWKVKRTQTQIDTNKCLILGSTTSLSAEWTFDNVYTDNSGNSNTLTATGSPTFPTDIPATCQVAILPSSILGLVKSFWIN